MKLKNYYAWLCPIWIIATVANTICCILNFVEGKFIVSIIFLVLAVSFSFVSGILLVRAITIYNHNKACDWLEKMAVDLRDEYMSQLQPFEECEK